MQKCGFHTRKIILIKMYKVSYIKKKELTAVEA